MNTVLKRAAALLLGTSALVGCVNMAMADEWTLGQPVVLGGLSEDAYAATLVSADGKVIVGTAWGDDGVLHAVSWVGGELKDLSEGTSGVFVPTAVSTNGNVIVGWTADTYGDKDRQAVAWLNGSGNPITLSPDASKDPDDPNAGGILSFLGEATAVSGDGKVIVGHMVTVDDNSHAVKWMNVSADAENNYATDLATLGGDNSDALAISRNGNVIVGWAQDNQNTQYAASWKGEAIAPEKLNGLGGEHSAAVGVSNNGNVIVGWAEDGSGQRHATSWTGGSTNATNLGQPFGALASAFTGAVTSEAVAVSGDGAVIIGNAADSTDHRRGLSWTNGQGEPIILNTLGGRNSNALAVSANGTVIVGDADASDTNQHAAAWVNGSTVAMDLGTLGGISSRANAVSDDGTVIVGFMTTAEDGLDHAALWKLVPPPAPDPDPKPTPPNPDPTPTPTPTPPTPTPVGIDVTNTVQTVAALAHDTFSVIESQRATLGRLQTSCDVWKAGESCYSISTDIGKSGNTKDMLGWMTLGHAFTDNFSAGISIAHSLWRDLPGDFDRDDNNIGGGLYARWRDQTANGSWYVQGSVAANRYDVERTRRVLGYTEPGTGDSTINGWGVQLEAGQSFDLANKASFGYYGGLRYDDLKMDGYTETNAYFPFTYSDVKSQRTTAYLGANYGMALTDSVRWSVNAEIEQDLSHKDPSVIASADYIGSYKFDSDAAHTRGSLSTTVSYAFSDAVSIGVTPYVNRTVNKDTAFGAIIGLSGKF